MSCDFIVKILYFITLKMLWNSLQRRAIALEYTVSRQFFAHLHCNKTIWLFNLRQRVDETDFRIQTIDRSLKSLMSEQLILINDKNFQDIRNAEFCNIFNLFYPNLAASLIDKNTKKLILLHNVFLQNKMQKTAIFHSLMSFLYIL